MTNKLQNPNSKLIKFFIVWIIWCLVFGVSASAVRAQTPTPPNPTPTPEKEVLPPAAQNAANADKIRLTAIPTKVEFEIDPGQVAQEELKVRNESEVELAIEVEVQDFVVFDDKGTPTPVNEDLSGRWAMSKWVTVSPSRLILQPNETKIVSLVINIPENALPGGHYTMITYKPVVDFSNSGSSSQLTQRVGTLTSLIVSGPINEDARITQFRTIPGFFEFGPIDFNTEILNLSDIHIQPQGQITVTNMLKKVSAVLPLEEVNIFPFVTREYNNTWQTKWGFGRYRAELEAYYGSTGQLATAVIYFWILPYRIIAAVVLMLFFLFVAWFVKKQRQIDQQDSGFKNL